MGIEFWCFRGAVGRLFMRVLHPDFLWKFGCWASKLSLRKNHGLSESQIRSLYHEYAQRKAREVSADVVILGHNHIPDDVTFELSGGKKTRYINIGDWVEHASFVTHQSDQFSLEKFAFDR
jgi:UDP-2,3-diacylglucosamine hydrolase